MSRRRISPKDKMCEFITFAVSMDDFDALNNRIASENLNRSAVLRSLVRTYVGNENGTPLAFPSTVPRGK
jgi:hypothetical protein